MLNLMKYEFRKDRNALLAAGGGLLLLELYFLYCVLTKNENHLGVSAVFLTLYATVCFFLVFALAALNYSRELNSKSSYLIFMTPNTSFTIILSKLITILILGSVMALIIGLLGWLDLYLGFSAIPDANTFSEFIQQLFNYIGLPLHQLLLSFLMELLIFLVSFFATVGIVYLSVTLSVTFLQNSKLKTVASIVFFLVITYVQYRIVDILPSIYDITDTALKACINALPATLFNLAVLIASIYACARLLDEKVSLG
ncbi:MAG: hypothetical protein PHR92_03420 [Lachnospiraceae bacterium]|nr:hypothetical protein [Lachnospiraceae bacterium]